MNPLLPIQRVRLELDRTLRGRPFFARALRDELTDDAYAGLVGQVAALVDAVSGDAHDIVVLAREDVAALASGRAATELAPAPPVRCAARMFAHAPLRQSDVDRAVEVTLAVVGTTWASEAADRIEVRSRRACSFLGALGARGTRSVRRLRETSGDWAHETHSVHAFAELTRGAFLGVATWLESTWPAPLLALTLDLKSTLGAGT